MPDHQYRRYFLANFPEFLAFNVCMYVSCHWSAGLSLKTLLSFVRVILISFNENFFFFLMKTQGFFFFLLRELKVIFFTLSCPHLNVSMVSLLMTFSHNSCLIFWPFTCRISGKSNSWCKAEKDKCICKEPHVVYYLFSVITDIFPRLLIFSERLMGGITGVFITHAVSIALMHYRQRSFLVTVLYLLKKHNFVNLFANSYGTYRIIFSGRYNCSHSTLNLCKGAWKQFQLLPFTLF